MLNTNMLQMTFCTICPEHSLQTHFLQQRGRRHIGLGLWGSSCPKGVACSNAYESKRQKRFCNKWRCLVCTCETFKILSLKPLNSLWWEDVCMAAHCRRKFSLLWPGASQFVYDVIIIHTYSNVHVVQIHQSAILKLLTVEMNSTDHLTIVQQYSAVKPWTLVFIWMPGDTNHLLKHHCKPSTPSRHWSPKNLAACFHTEATRPKECDNKFATSTWPQDSPTCCAWKCTGHRVRTFTSVSGFNVVADKIHIQIHEHKARTRYTHSWDWAALYRTMTVCNIWERETSGSYAEDGKVKTCKYSKGNEFYF